MNHREAQELLAWYAAGTLDADETSAVQSHVDDCRSLETEALLDRGRIQDKCDGNQAERNKGS